MALLLVLVCLLAVVVLGVGGLFVWQNNPAAVARQQLPQSDAGPPQERESTAQRNSARSSAASIAEVRQAAERQQMVGPNNSELRVADRDERAGNVTSRDERTPRASVMQKMPSPTTPGMSRPSISADTQTGDMPAKKDASMPAVAEVNSERAAAIRTSLTAARDALALGDLDKVDELLDQAMFDASTDTLRAQVEGVRAVRAYVGSFWNAVRESLKTVNSGTEIEIDGDIVIVVEISRNRDNLVVRMRGANRRFDVQQLPAELAVGLAQRWLDKDDVNSRAFIGTYLATSGRRDDAQRGRRMLNEAKGAGSEVAKTVLEHLDP